MTAGSKTDVGNSIDVASRLARFKLKSSKKKPEYPL